MKASELSTRQLFGIFVILFVLLLCASTLSAWSGPTQAPPGGNVPAPVNVGTTNQVKNGGLSVTSFLASANSQFLGNVHLYKAGSALRLGINRSSAVVALDVNGTLRLASGGEACQSVTEGAQRYNATSKAMEYCNGSAWLPLAASPWTVSGSNVHRTTGNVGIRTASPATPLDVDGTTRTKQLNVQLLCNYDGKNCKQVDANAQIIVKSQLTGTTRAQWNALVEDAASKRSNLMPHWRNDCRWDQGEPFPTTVGPQLDNCGLWICRTQFNTGDLEISQLTHCGTGGADCPAERYQIKCFY